MSIGDVFTKAWELWRRDIGWLILAGLVVGLIVGVIGAIVFGIVFGMLAVSVGGIALGSSGDSTSLTGLGVGTLIVAFLLGVVGYLIVSVLALVFYGGMFEMVLGAARETRGVNFGDLFSGFRKFGSFIVLWLVVAGISIVCGIVALIPIIGIIAVLVFAAWLGTTWLYILPLIADRGLTFGEAARTSSQMVKGVGWWKTFGTIIVLGAAFFVIGLVISLIGRASSTLSSLLLLVFEVAAGPFAICYVGTMYLGSGGEAVLAPAASYGTPAPPAYGGAPYVAPLAGGQVYQPIAPPPIAPPIAAGEVTAATAAVAGTAPPEADAGAWKAAADPLAPPSAAEPTTDAPPPRCNAVARRGDRMRSSRCRAARDEMRTMTREIHLMTAPAFRRLQRSPLVLLAALALGVAALFTAVPVHAGPSARDPVEPGAVSAWTTDSLVTVFLTTLADLGFFDEVRFAVDDAGFGEWRPLVPPVTVQLPEHDGAHVIHIQMAGTLLDPGELGSPDDPLELDVSTILDTLGPVTLAPEAVSAARDGRATLRIRVRDDLSPRAQVRVRIDDQIGRTVRIHKLGECPTGRAVVRSVALKLPRGRYRYRVLATDLAGNAQRKAGANDLVVR